MKKQKKLLQNFVSRDIKKLIFYSVKVTLIWKKKLSCLIIGIIFILSKQVSNCSSFGEDGPFLFALFLNPLPTKN
jgi:hypothetical protein